ncbi:GspH/FimT family pseudopilin [Ferrimonas pelagia]
MEGKKQTGLTLVELLIAVSIAAILLGVGAPQLSGLMANARADNEIDTLYQDLISTRYLAMAYQNNITVCPLDEKGSCVNQWQDGYTVFVDDGGDGVLGEDDEILQQRSAIHPQDALKVSHSQIRFSPDGFTMNTGTFIYCPLTANSDNSRKLSIYRTGRVRYHDNGSHSCS